MHHHHEEGQHTHTHHSHEKDEHTHTGIEDIRHLLGHLDISDTVRRDALAVYQLIAEAESRAHGKPVEQVHFHEVGTMDAVADVVGVCLLMEQLAPEQVVCSPVHVGSGQVRCAHGILPVPAPATAYILKGIPSYGGQIKGELCTPTGAALIKYFADEFGDQPVMATAHIGYGMGSKDFAMANCVRAFLGNTSKQDPHIVELVCTLDDATGEELGYVSNLLMNSGALDVYNVPIQMKKNRPGQMLVCICTPEKEETMAALMLRHTTTFGVRSRDWRRYTLEREIVTMETEFGPVRVKKGYGYGVKKSKLEYEDLAKISEENSLDIVSLKKQLNHLLDV